MAMGIMTSADALRPSALSDSQSDGPLRTNRLCARATAITTRTMLTAGKGWMVEMYLISQGRMPGLWDSSQRATRNPRRKGTEVSQGISADGFRALAVRVLRGAVARADMAR